MMIQTTAVLVCASPFSRERQWKDSRIGKPSPLLPGEKYDSPQWLPFSLFALWACFLIAASRLLR